MDHTANCCCTPQVSWLKNGCNIFPLNPEKVCKNLKRVDTSGSYPMFSSVRFFSWSLFDICRANRLLEDVKRRRSSLTRSRLRFKIVKQARQSERSDWKVVMVKGAATSDQFHLLCSNHQTNKLRRSSSLLETAPWHVGPEWSGDAMFLWEQAPSLQTAEQMLRTFD